MKSKKPEVRKEKQVAKKSASNKFSESTKHACRPPKPPVRKPNK